VFQYHSAVAWCEESGELGHVRFTSEAHSIQRHTIRLAGVPLAGVTVRIMADPRLQFTFQELIYAATALRQQARWSERKAADPQYGSSREIFSTAARSQDELAEKFQRIACEIAPPPRRRR
jgi:hypothetical protein